MNDDHPGGMLEELKADPHTAAIPVFIVSAYTEALSRQAAALATAVIAKPFFPPGVWRGRASGSFL